MAAILALCTCCTSTTSTDSSKIVHLSPPETMEIVSGGHTTCLLTHQSRPLCWGGSGIAGGDVSSIAPPTWITAPPFVSVSVGAGFACALDALGRAYCWGSNDRGQLGDGTRTDRTTPEPVHTTLRFVELAAGSNACGLTSDGRVYCWGPGDLGELGDGIDSPDHYSSFAVPVSNDVRFSHVAAGLMGVCAIAADGQTWCWGEEGAIVQARTSRASTASDASCAGRYDIRARCAVPQPVDGGHSFTSLALTSVSACGLDAQGAEWCWGLAQFGTLGDGNATFMPAITPVRVAFEGSLTSTTAGADFACALDTQGAAWCWGNNFRGRLGIGTTEGGTYSPVAVAGGLHFVALSSGSLHTCGIADDQSVYCWGVNLYGQLGQSPSVLAQSPVPVRVDLPPER